MRREFLQLAKKYNPDKHSPAGMFVSEKLDGCRCWWDGGISRGVSTVEVPWANVVNPKTGEMKKKIKPVATGLWSRYGNPIIAPDWWLNQLPQIFLDGELFAGRGNFQMLRSIVARDEPDERWNHVRLAVFDAPPVSRLFLEGEIKNPNYTLQIKPAEIKAWLREREDAGVVPAQSHTGDVPFEMRLRNLSTSLPIEGSCHLHWHTKLPYDKETSQTVLNEMMVRIMDAGGEGVMLHSPEAIWTPKRVSGLLKYKPFKDDQGTVTGFVSGRKTNKGSKLRGLIGAVVLDYKGKRLELSGFTDIERRFSTEEQAKFAWDHPGEDMPADFQGEHIKVGATLEFRFRELSVDGLPKEARFYRGV